MRNKIKSMIAGLVAATFATSASAVINIGAGTAAGVPLTTVQIPVTVVRGVADEPAFASATIRFTFNQARVGTPTFTGAAVAPWATYVPLGCNLSTPGTAVCSFLTNTLAIPSVPAGSYTLGTLNFPLTAVPTLPQTITAALLDCTTRQGMKLPLTACAPVNGLITGGSAVTAVTPSGSVVLPGYTLPTGSSSTMLNFNITGANGAVACVAGGAGYTATPNPRNLVVGTPGAVSVTYTGAAAGTFAGTLTCTPVTPATGGPFNYTLSSTVSPVVGVAPTISALTSPVTLNGGVGSIPITLATLGTAGGSLGLACTIPATGASAFAITSGANRTIAGPAALGANAPAIGLTCLPGSAPVVATLSCAQTPTPASTLAPLTSQVTCAAAPPPSITPSVAPGDTVVLPPYLTPGPGSSATALSFGITGGSGQLACAASGAGYTAAPNPVNLTVAGSNVVSVTYTGATAGTFNGALVCTSVFPATGGPFTYPLTTTVSPVTAITAALTSTTLTFASTAVGANSATQNVVIAAASVNSGSIIINDCSIDGANGAAYKFDPAFGAITLDAGATGNLAVRFAPTSLTPATQTAAVTCTTSTATATVTGTVNLSGTVTQPPMPTAPGAPTGVSASAGNASATVSFIAPSNDGGSAITRYAATCGGIQPPTERNVSPITVRGLTNGAAVTCSVVATNAVGNSVASALSNSVTPTQPVTASIDFFTATPASGPSGTQTSLAWTTTGVNVNCTLSGPGLTPAVVASPQAVTVTGSSGDLRDFTLDCAGVTPPKTITFTISNTITNPTTITAVMADPVAMNAIVPVNNLCSGATTGTALDQQCKLITDSNASATTVVTALRAVSAEELSTIVTNGQDNLNFAHAGVTSRLSALRGGARGQSVNNMAFNYDGKQIPTGALVGTLVALLGIAQYDEAAAGGGLLDQRLGFFGQALVRRGDRDVTLTESGYDFDGYQAVFGVDYRFTNRFVAGLALGGGKINADLGGSGGKLDTRARFFTGFASFAPSDRVYLEFALTRLRNDYKQERVIDLSGLRGASGVQGTRSVAFGDTSGNQTKASLAAGYSYNFGATSVTPNLHLSFGQTRVDGFNEAGASPFLLRIPNQSFDSLQYALGVNLQRTISLETGVFAPYANFELVFESKNDAFTINTCFIRAADCAGNNAISVNIAKADSRFGRSELGFTYLTEDGLQLGMAYTETLGYSFLTSRSFSLMGRYEF